MTYNIERSPTLFRWYIFVKIFHDFYHSPAGRRIFLYNTQVNLSNKENDHDYLLLPPTVLKFNNNQR
jgi:hypothetical protein